MSKLMNFKDQISEDDLKFVANEIKAGKIAVFPTETVYGIGTNAFNENAVEKIYEIKKRPKTKALSLLVCDMHMIESLAQNITEAEYKIMKAFFPGPLTIVLKKKRIVPSIVTAGSEYVGIRMPGFEIIKKIIEYANVPIAAPSANISGMPSGINIKDAMKDFGENVDYYIDGGDASLKQSSTVVKIEDENPIILRQGIITKEQIKEAIK